jgi:ADP-ribose pyrophosphatase
VATEYPFRGKIATVRIDQVVMPGGQVAAREVVEHDLAVAVVAVDLPGPGTDGEPQVVLIEQYRHPFRRRFWELPAGLMDVDGEPSLTTAQRELAEETGLAAESWSLLVDVVTSPGFITESVRIFLATGLRPVQQDDAVDEEAELEVVRLPLSEAVRATLDGRIANVMAVTGILAAAHALTTGLPLRDPQEPTGEEPWTLHRGPGVPDAPPLPAAVPVDPAEPVAP